MYRMNCQMNRMMEEAFNDPFFGPRYAPSQQYLTNQQPQQQQPQQQQQPGQSDQPPASASQPPQVALATNAPPRRGNNDLDIWGPRWLNPFSHQITSFNPTVDMTETENSFLIKADCPGVNKEDIRLATDTKRGTITISGEMKNEKTEGNSDSDKSDGKVHYTERTYGSFSRVMPIPDHVDVNKITAAFENGVLKVEIPKDHESKTQNVRSITIQ